MLVLLGTIYVKFEIEVIGQRHKIRGRGTQQCSFFGYGCSRLIEKTKGKSEKTSYDSVANWKL